MGTTPPGRIRDSILGYLGTIGCDASLDEIHEAVRADLGLVAPSSVRSYLNLNTPQKFIRTSKGRYSISRFEEIEPIASSKTSDFLRIGKAKLYTSDCMSWLATQSTNSVHAVITDPPYGIREYSAQEQDKLRRGRGGMWRIPPSFDGHVRSPLPRFTVLDDDDRAFLLVYFKNFARLLYRVVVPGGNIAVASNPLLAHIVSSAFSAGGFEIRGSVVRLTMTMRGGDRPKNAHTEFDGVSVMPRSMWEPWVIARKPIEGRVQDNLRKWKTGGWRRPSEERPFGDVIRSSPATQRERKIANHPSLKPQSFLRQLVRASLPLGEGVVLDPFAGSGSTLAACNFVGYESIGVEKDPVYAKMAAKAIGPLSRLDLVDPIGSQLFDSVAV
ncbi:MAG: DNA methyltransferase [Acidobacteriaceae bacterium]|jgi:site-specific DNA-methyltransferase (adenine-specific)